MKILALFPGQGSQRVGMGKALAEQLPLAAEYFSRANDALGFDLARLCFEGPEDQLTATAVAQPAILTVSTICFHMARAHFGESLEVVAAAGHSLGEYSALVAAGALSFEDAVRLVHKRGTYMQEAVPAGKGKMIAVLGMELTELESKIDALNAEPEHLVQVANINAPGQIVVAGRAESIDALAAALQGVKSVQLPVSAPFHCALMKPAEDRLAQDLATTAIAEATVPVYANYSARAVREPQEIRETLRLQVCGRVRWIECVQHAVKECNPQMAIEFGAGNVLTGLMKRIDNAVPRATIDSLDSLQKVALG